MQPLSEPIVNFAESNPFSLALLGLERHARQIVEQLPSPIDAGVHDISPEPHPLDLVLLGLTSLVERLDRIAPTADDVQLGEPTEPSAHHDVMTDRILR